MKCHPLLAVVLVATPAAAQSPHATARESTRTFPTYPYDDPNPHPIVGRIYPYFRFDGFTDSARAKGWKTVELENQYLKILILPEIGGKIWAAIEKKSNRSFIYSNSVVKFRDIAMRGPWTSGGIEANYGIIGHTPTVASPVDYLVRENPDGSAECVIGALDLLTRAQWRLTIRLPKDAAYFTTSSLWYNASELEQPYYTWMNTGIKAAGGLEFTYPGTSYLGHGGEHASWPVNSGNGREISRYENNDFGGYKSYHVFGGYTDFFGAYWHDDELGMVRWAPRNEKPGKKIWIWGLSRQGMIWDKLLTDTDGQYVEVQSGRLFNQTNEQSTFTPFKHRGFAPKTTDRWTESWYPVVGTGGIVAANDRAALNVIRRHGRVVVILSPVADFADTLAVWDGNRAVLRRAVAAHPLELVRDSVADVPDARLKITLGGAVLYQAADSTTLSRPLESPANFDWHTSYGLHLRGKELMRDREYAGATRFIDQSLARDSNFVPALADRAALAYRALDDSLAIRMATRALSIDTYDPAANYYYGLANARSGRLADARDGFDIATQSAEFRPAALLALARLAFRQGDRSSGARHLTAIGWEGINLDQMALSAWLNRRRGDPGDGAKAERGMLLVQDPLSAVARFEQVLAGERTASDFLAGLRSELPTETLLETAAWYLAIDAFTEADSVLSLAGPAAEPLYWRAWIHHRQGRDDAVRILAQADSQSTRMVFPFRSEADPIFAWATSASASWKPAYYRALVRWAAGDTATAGRLLNTMADRPDDATFYTARAALDDGARAARDLARARTLAPDDWRIGKTLVERLLRRGATGDAVARAREYAAKRPRDYIMGVLLATALVRDGRYAEAEPLLAGLNVLPYEGAGEARGLYREVKLMRAVQALSTRAQKAARVLVAQAREWPEHLGAGKPYPADVDERLEDLVDAEVLARSGRSAAAITIWRSLAGTPSAGDRIAGFATSRLAGGIRVMTADLGDLTGRVLSALGRFSEPPAPAHPD